MTSQLKITKIIQPHTALGPFTGSFPCKNGPSHMISDEEGQKLQKTSNLTEYNTLNPFNSSFLFTNGPTDIMIITQGPTLREKIQPHTARWVPLLGPVSLQKRPMAMQHVWNQNAKNIQPHTAHWVLLMGHFLAKNRTQSHHDQ